MHETTDQRLYTLRFFQVFGAVMLVMIGTSLQYHFGQYVSFRGYGVDVLGRMLGASMLGALMIRLRVGRWIDRYGVKPVWCLGTMIAGLSVASMQFVGGVFVITALRTLAVMAVSSAMTAGTVFAAHIAPPGRRAESIGSMGLAGFMGMLVGPALGDLIFRSGVDSITPYRIFFLVSGGCSILSGLIAATVPMHTDAAARNANPGAGLDERDTRRESSHRLSEGSGRVPNARGAGIASAGRVKTPSQLQVIRAHWPGMVLLIGVSFSMVFTVQSMFLERFAEARGFEEIKTFFYVYCPTAITLRVIFRRVPQRFGRTRTILLGCGLMSIGLVVLTRVTSEMGLVLPGVLMGAGHCFIFPSMVDLSASRLPPEYRGTGTALILGAGDVGMLIGFTVLGEVISIFGYTAALFGLAGMLVVVAAALMVARRTEVFGSRTPRTSPLRSHHEPQGDLVERSSGGTMRP